MEFPGFGLRETLTEEKRRICIDSLMKYMADGHNTSEAVREYVLGQINTAIKRKGLKISKLANDCVMEDFCAKNEKPADYLRNILNGMKNMPYTALDRLVAELDLMSDEIFPFKGKSRPCHVAEYVLFPAA